MALLPVWLIVSAFALFFAGLICWIWLNNRLEAHMRRRHATLSLELFAVPDDSWQKDEEKGFAAQAAARARLRDFIRSGAAARLNDAELTRILGVRMWITRMQWACIIVGVSMALFFVLRR